MADFIPEGAKTIVSIQVGCIVAIILIIGFVIGMGIGWLIWG